ncbi:cysteine synthase A [Tenacibaculum sp. MAR_2009_124]|uniref:PLP-dependent cysteine synthase family protein n=1 Tax=Tenacibaculum sp. MAR_2009_124 TaxID=1250059 RepID=UPI0008951B5B|nr:PLP-dependent cysteine synthase family protein [Tenacibaculum sp. MAR_2009_124]SEB75136.1 cysteine synthase A [Tenacibaculum sp. MAR_2009_124]
MKNRKWTSEAINKIKADFNRSADTHLIKLNLPYFKNIDIYLKDESTHPSGSLKHRLARSLFLYGLCNGKINSDTTIIEASSGSTAISEAYFARLLGLPFIAVLPESTSPEKIELIEFNGGKYVKVPSTEIYNKAESLTREMNGYYMDQFTYAERATDWRGNNNIAESIFDQMSNERHEIPSWIVVGAGTGGTSATIGRYIKYNPQYNLATQLAVTDPENSVFYEYYQTRDEHLTSKIGSRIEGIGRPRVEPSFQPDVIDRMMKVKDAASIATLRWLSAVLGRKCGGSTGTNVYATLNLAEELLDANQTGSIVTMICDSGDRYTNTYYNDDWLKKENIDIAPYLQELEKYS